MDPGQQAEALFNYLRAQSRHRRRDQRLRRHRRLPCGQGRQRPRRPDPDRLRHRRPVARGDQGRPAGLHHRPAAVLARLHAGRAPDALHQVRPQSRPTTSSPARPSSTRTTSSRSRRWSRRATASRIPAPGRAGARSPSRYRTWSERPGPAWRRHRHDRGPPTRGAMLGEALRRFMLRPEVDGAGRGRRPLHRSSPILSPTSFPTKLTFVSIMAVAAELGIVSIGVTLLMIGGHFDLSVGAVLGLTSYVAVVLMRDFGLSPLDRDAGRGRGRARALGFVNGAHRGALPHPLLRGHARHDADLARHADRADRRLPDDGRDPAGCSRRRCPGRSSAASACRCSGSSLIGAARRRSCCRAPASATGCRPCGQNPQAARNLGVPVDRVTVILFMITSALAAVAGRHPGGALRLGRRAARRGHGAAGGGGDRHRRHAALGRLRQRHRHRSSARSPSA